ncbi:hypothetical protein [uncultured Polaribacter sp.]|uniref:HD domain-containing protein n=1 Tax=uncultured Polaribacter sp. TaxID=174711 RepID=UPI00260F8B88|nr:hypothetical protein [uncultured Polaribacter sp.]
MDVKNLQKDWLELGQKYCQDLLFLNATWKKIEKRYGERNRHYHTLAHIECMLTLAKENKTAINDFDEVLFSIWFHDIIYKSRSKKNEEKSVKFAEKVLKKFNLKELKQEKVSQLILSTKAHKIIADKDIDNSFLLDFDLAILAQNWGIYEDYTQKIRKEYKMFPNFMYIPSRKKVLESFLNREKLYFTEKYQNLFEEKARKNLQKELSILR